MRSGPAQGGINMYPALGGSGCICGKRMFMFENFGTCVWCGHGYARSILDGVDDAYRRNMEALPAPVMTTPQFDARVVPLRCVQTGWTEDECVAAYYAWRANHGREPSAMDWQKAKAHGEKRPSYAHVRKLFGGWVAFKRYIAEIPREQVAA